MLEEALANAVDDALFMESPEVDTGDAERFEATATHQALGFEQLAQALAMGPTLRRRVTRQHPTRDAVWEIATS